MGSGCSPSLSHQLARYLVNTKLEDVPAAVVSKAKMCIMDWFGCALAGVGETPGQILVRTALDTGGIPQATIVSGDARTSALMAAFVNAGLAHMVELDDVHRGSVLHPGAPIVASALAAAEAAGANGRELIRAVVLGYEVAIRIGAAVAPSHYYYWHSTGTCGTFGAAAAAGLLLGLNEDQMTHALGTAGTQAAGLWEFLSDGAMSKHLHAAKAAMNGFLAAYLAKLGFTGARRILEGDRGFFRATSAQFDPGKVTEGLGHGYKIMETSFKLHSSCRHTHAAIDTARRLVRHHNIEPNEVRSILVETYRDAINIAGNQAPNSPYAAKFSLPFCVALATARHGTGPEEFCEATLADPVIRRLMSVVQLKIDPTLDAYYPERWPARLTITTRNGQSVTAESEYPLGDPENPIGEEELRAKFLALAKPRLGEPRAEGLLQAITMLEQLETAEHVTKWVTRN